MRTTCYRISFFTRFSINWAMASTEPLDEATKALLETKDATQADIQGDIFFLDHKPTELEVLFLKAKAARYLENLYFSLNNVSIRKVKVKNPVFATDYVLTIEQCATSELSVLRQLAVQAAEDE